MLKDVLSPQEISERHEGSTWATLGTRGGRLVHIKYKRSWDPNGPFELIGFNSPRHARDLWALRQTDGQIPVYRFVDHNKWEYEGDFTAGRIEMVNGVPERDVPRSFLQMEPLFVPVSPWGGAPLQK